MSIESTLYGALSTDATLLALVGEGSPLVGKIYPNVAPDSVTAPYITYQLIGGMPHNLMAGAPQTERKVFQINCISNTYSNAKAIAEAVKGAVNASIAYVTSEADDYFPQTQNHRVRLDIALIG